MKPSKCVGTAFFLLFFPCSKGPSVEVANQQHLQTFGTKAEFKNIIVWAGQCGTEGGLESHLINTEKAHRYKVTVSIKWNQSVKSGVDQKTFISEAGGDLFIGCSQTTTFPRGFDNYAVSGEVAL